MGKKLPVCPIREGMIVDVPAIGPDYRFHGTSYTTKGKVLFVSQSGGFALAEIRTKAGRYYTSIPISRLTGKPTDGVRNKSIQGHITRPRTWLYGDVLPQRSRN